MEIVLRSSVVVKKRFAAPGKETADPGYDETEAKREAPRRRSVRTLHLRSSEPELSIGSSGISEPDGSEPIRDSGRVPA